MQLADRAGAHVVASVGTAERGEGLVALAEVYALLAPGGSVQSVGMASLAPTTIDFEQARRAGGGARIEAFVVGPGFGLDLAFLLSLVGSGGLDPQVDWRGPWEKAPDAVDALLGRQVRGKAVLDVTS